MNTKTLRFCVALFGVTFITAFAQTPTFTYQGRLNDTNGPVTGTATFTFRILSAASGGAQFWQETTNGVPVTNGLFTVELGTVMPLIGPVFDGSDRWLELVVNGTTLTNRQKFTHTPYAIRAREAATASLANSATAVAAGGVVTTSLQNDAVTSAKIADGSITAADVNSASFSNMFWKVDGNAGTTTGTHFIGTTDNQPLEVRVNGERVLRLEPNATSPNLIGGFRSNSIATGADAAVIVGGGRAGYENRAGAELTFIGGGWANTNGGGGSFLGGGFLNRIEPFAYDSTLSGGRENIIRSNTFQTTISGGLGNAIWSGASCASVGGGRENQIGLNASYSSIAGGYGNTVFSNAGYATMGGGFGNNIQPQATYATLGGGYHNVIGTNAQRATIAGGQLNQVEAATATVGGGGDNRIEAGAYSATVAGGYGNIIGTNSPYATIGGGYQNVIGTNSYYSIMVGGYRNGIGNNSWRAFLGGGYQNIIQSWAIGATLAGGSDNLIHSAYHATLSGGQNNTIWSNASYATVSGGYQNKISEDGSYATIPGGRKNSATNSAFAAGTRAKAEHMGAFVWADSLDADFGSTASDQFNVRAGGGVRFETSGAGLSVDGQPVLNALSALSASQLNSGTVPDARLSANVARRNAPNEFFFGPQTLYAGGASTTPLVVRGNIGQSANLQQWENSAGSVLASVSASGVFNGNGSGLTALNASQLASGTMPDARLSTNVALLNANQTLGGSNVFTKPVGIGTTSPSQMLHVRDGSGPSGNGGRIQVGANAAGADPKLIYFGDTGYVSIGEDGADDRMEIRAKNLVVTNILSGIAVKVGIGREPLVNRLEVEGDASKATAGGWLANSDVRIKQDIQPVTDALDKLEQVRLVSFRYTDDYRGQHSSVADRRYLNVVAQEFRDVFPEDVKSSGEKLPDGSEILQVDTYPLTIYSAAAIQELNRDLKKKEREIAELNRTVNELKALVEAMNRKLNGGAR